MSELIKPFTIQSKTLLIEGSPEGVLDGVYGLKVMDMLTATYYTKKTGLGHKTGWQVDNGPGLIQIILGAVGIYTAKSIPEIQAIASAPANRICMYDGFLTGGDNGGSGTFTWDPLSTEPDNGFSCLQPTDQGGNPAIPGRWAQMRAA